MTRKEPAEKPAVKDAESVISPLVTTKCQPSLPAVLSQSAFGVPKEPA